MFKARKVRKKARKSKRVFASNSDYEKYLGSPAWAKKKKGYASRHKMRCFVCRSTICQLHHRTYVHIYNELDEDLVYLCRPCHEAAHEAVKQGKTSLYNAHIFLSYLRSPEWEERKTKYFSTYAKKCFVCEVRDSFLYHKTCVRLGNELDEDLMCLCKIHYEKACEAIKQGQTTWDSAHIFIKDLSLLVRHFRPQKIFKLISRECQGKGCRNTAPKSGPLCKVCQKREPKRLLLIKALGSTTTDNFDNFLEGLC